MSGAYAAAVPDGPLGSPAAGCVRLLSSTLTREASTVFSELGARWRADAARARQAASAPAAKGKRSAVAAEHPWAELLSPLDELGCLADADAVVRSLRAFLAVQTAALPLPADPPTHPGVEPFVIGDDDERAELRGQRGLRAAEPLAAGTVLGCLRASVMTLREWGATTRSDAECAFTADYPLFNARHSTGLIASAFGCGNIVALVNDGRGSRDTERPCNCALIEVLIRGCPSLVLVTLVPISTGEELLRSYGDAFWARLQAAGAASAGGVTAEPADLPPLMRQRSKSSANERGLAPATAPDAAEAAGLGAAADTASCGGFASIGPWAAAAVPVSVAAEAPASSVAPMSLVARLGRCAGDAAPTCLAGVLRLHGTTKGDDPAATLQPLLPQFHRCAFVLAPPADASPQTRTALAKFAARLTAKGKAARCNEAVPGGRAVYLLPPGALALGMLALLGVPPLPEAVAAAPHLLAFVLRAAAPPQPLAVAAPAPPLAAAAMAPPPRPPPAPVAALPPQPAEPAPDAAKVAPPAPPPAILTSLPAPSVQPPPHVPPVTLPFPSAPLDTRFPPGLLELAVAYFTAPERAGRCLNKQGAADGIHTMWQQDETLARLMRPNTRVVWDLINEHREWFVCGRGEVWLQSAVAEQLPRAAPPPPPAAALSMLPTLAAAAAGRADLPPPHLSRPGSLPWDVRFPPGLAELAIAYVTAPERAGQVQTRPETISAIWEQVKLVPEWTLRPRAMVLDLVNNHPAFVYHPRLVLLRDAPPATAAAAAAPTPVAAMPLPGGAAPAPEAAVATERVLRERSRSRSPQRKRADDDDASRLDSLKTEPHPPPPPPSPAAVCQAELPPSPRGRDAPPSETRFPPKLVELAVAYFSAPERVGRCQPKQTVIFEILTAWRQIESFRGGGAVVRDLVTEHPAFKCAMGVVSLRSWGAEQLPGAAQPPATAPTVPPPAPPPPVTTAAPMACVATEPARRSRSRSPPSRRAAVADQAALAAALPAVVKPSAQHEYDARLHAWLGRRGRWCHVGEEVYPGVPPPRLLLGAADQPRRYLVNFLLLHPARYAVSAQHRFVCCVREADGQPEHGPLPFDEHGFVWTPAVADLLRASAEAHAAQHQPGAASTVLTSPPGAAPAADDAADLRSVSQSLPRAAAKTAPPAPTPAILASPPDAAPPELPLPPAPPPALVTVPSPPPPPPVPAFRTEMPPPPPPSFAPPSVAPADAVAAEHARRKRGRSRSRSRSPPSRRMLRDAEPAPDAAKTTQPAPPPPIPTLPAPSVQPPPPVPPVTLPFPSAPLDTRFPPGLLELAVAYFTTPERAGRCLNKKGAADGIYRTWEQDETLARLMQPNVSVIWDLIDEHRECFACGRGGVWLQSAVAEQLPRAAPPPPPAAAPSMLSPTLLGSSSATAADPALDMRREEEAFLHRLVAFFHAKNATSLPRDTVSGACQLTPPLRRKYATLSAFLIDPANAEAGALFRLDGRSVVLQRQSSAAVAPEAAVEHARRKLSCSRSRSCSPPGKRDVADQEHNADLRREVELLIGRVVAYFHAKESMSLPFHSVAGACQLTPLLRRKYATLRAFLVDPANARSGVRFRVEGENLLFPRHCIEAAYIADVVRQLRLELAGELSLPVLGERCPLPAVLMPPGCLAVLLAHRDVLQVHRPSKRGSHIVRLAQRAETTLPDVGTAVSPEAAVVAGERARRKRSRSRSRSRSPPSKRAADDAPDLRRLLPPGRHV